MDNKIFILHENETPEQLMIYLNKFDTKVSKNLLLTEKERLAFLKRIVNKEAQTIVSKVEESFEAYAQPDDIEKIHNHWVRSEILAEYDTDDKVRTCFVATESVAYKKNRVQHIINESIYHLKVKNFWYEQLGLSSFVQVKRTTK